MENQIGEPVEDMRGLADGEMLGEVVSTIGHAIHERHFILLLTACAINPQHQCPQSPLLHTHPNSPKQVVHCPSP
jgi:hypothetical protein